MSAKCGQKNTPRYCKLSAIVNFGPEPTQYPPEKADFNSRVKEIVKKLSDINSRIDRLNQKA